MQNFKINSFKPKSQEFAWLCVVRNEGLRFINQLNSMSKHYKEIDIWIVDGNSNDGSTDEKILKECHVTGVIVSQLQKGFSADLQLGFDHLVNNLGYKGIVTIDGNGKDSTDNVIQMLESLRNGFDFVQGSRFIAGGNHKNTPKIRWLGIRLIAAPITSAFCRKKITDPTNGFRGYGTELLKNPKLGIFEKDFKGYGLVSYVPVAASRASARVTEIPVQRGYPDDGTVPTKIVSVRQYFEIFYDLFRAGFNRYDSKANGGS